MEPKTRRALMAVPLIDEQRPPANYVNPVTLGSRKIRTSRARSNSPNLNRIVRHPGQPQLQDHVWLSVKKLNETCIWLVQCIGTGSIGFYVFIISFH